MRNWIILPLTGSLIATSLVACSSRYEFIDGGNPPKAALLGPARSSCPSGNATPTETVQSRVDLLFVADTSGSMKKTRRAVAQKIDGFIDGLPAGADFDVAVVLAHGSTSPWTGRLYSYGEVPRVLKSSEMSAADIELNLEETLTHVAVDKNADYGEEGVYSFMRSLDAENLADARVQGFYREDAALAVVFLSDEDDICALHPAGKKLDYVTDPELEARARDCAEGIAPETVISRVKEVQGDRPFTFAGINHTDPAYVTHRETEDSYGYGYQDIVKASQGIAVDIDDSDYAPGLAKIAQLTVKKIASTGAANCTK